MKEEERQIQSQQGSGPGGGDGAGGEPEGEGLEEARRAQGAAQERIAKLLSGNSAAYVAHSAQHGGQ